MRGIASITLGDEHVIQLATTDAFDDAYRGEAASEEDYAYEFVQDTSLRCDVPESLRMYFDYDAYARDLFSSGLVFVDGYVFQN